MPASSHTHTVGNQGCPQFIKNWDVWIVQNRLLQIDKAYFFLGILSMVAFWVQFAFEIKWPWLIEMQTHENFKQVTGLALAIFIGHQWYLSKLRINGDQKAAKSHYQKHKGIGALGVLLFYIHTTQLGYAYLFVLSVVYFSNVLVGLCNLEILRLKQKWFSSSWLVVHVSLSVLLVCLTIFHIFIALIYE